MKYTDSFRRLIKLPASIIMFLLCCLVSYSCGGTDDGISEPPETPVQTSHRILTTRRMIGEPSTMESYYLLYGHRKI